MAEDKNAALEVKIDKLEQMLADEIKARRELEKRVNDLNGQLTAQRESNEENSRAMAAMNTMLQSLMSSSGNHQQ